MRYNPIPLYLFRCSNCSKSGHRDSFRGAWAAVTCGRCCESFRLCLLTFLDHRVLQPRAVGLRSREKGGDSVCPVRPDGCPPHPPAPHHASCHRTFLLTALYAGAFPARPPSSPTPPRVAPAHSLAGRPFPSALPLHPRLQRPPPPGAPALCRAKAPAPPSRAAGRGSTSTWGAATGLISDESEVTTGRFLA